MRRLSSLVVLLTAFATQAQMSNQGNETVCTLRVDVQMANKGEPAAGLRVELYQGLAGATPYQVGLTNSSGSAEFENLFPGDYRAEVSGEGIETTNSPNIHIENGRVFMSQLVVVRMKGDGKASGETPTVSVHELKVPQKALQELETGDTEMQKQHWKKAADHFQKAVAEYPQYTSGYYNLSVAFLRMGQGDKQRDALQKALKLDGKFVPALLSLAHLDFADHKLPETRDLLDKAISADPTNIDALALEVRVDFMQGKYKEAVADAQRVHNSPHQGYATVHYTAAAAYQQMGSIPDTINQLKLYLQEDPNSPNANYVRQTIKDLADQHRRL
jgi:predicted Zn-dependent protease